MTTKHWKISLCKNRRRIVLIAATSQEMIATDLNMDAERSLIQTARQFHRRPQTPDQDHRDLAIGAVMAYAAAPSYDLEFEHLETCPGAPDRAPDTHVGGRRNEKLVPIWEESVNEEPCDPDEDEEES
jgi:hypothetical protein